MDAVEFHTNSVEINNSGRTLEMDGTGLRQILSISHQIKSPI